MHTNRIKPTQPTFTMLPTLRTHAPLLLAALAMIATALLLPQHPFVDEYAHWPTAQQFAQGQWPLNPGISTWPTMNALVGWITAVFGASRSILAGRLVIVGFGLIALAAFYRIAQQFDRSAAGLRTAQFFLSPIVLPFCALVYTDLPALACLLWATVGALRRQAWLLLLAGLLACAMRQNNIVWFAGLCLLYGGLCLHAGERLRLWVIAGAVAIGAAWLFVVRLQHGVAAGSWTQSDHPGNLAGMPNVWFALAVAAIVYLPYFVQRLGVEGIRVPLWQVLALGLTIGFTFHVTHRFNLIEIQYFVRNYLLHRTLSAQGMSIFLATVMTTALLVARTRLGERQELLWPLLLFSVLSLLPFSLIEQRYYLPPFALFWAMRASVDRRIEILQLLFGAAAALWMVLRIGQGLHFV